MRIVLPICGLLLSTLAGCGQSGTSAPEPVVEEVKVKTADRTMTRDDFKILVMGKTPEEVSDTVGKPTKTDADISGSKVWIYEGKTIDTVTGNTDEMTILSFHNGKVGNVSYR